MRKSSKLVVDRELNENGDLKLEKLVHQSREVSKCHACKGVGLYPRKEKELGG